MSARHLGKGWHYYRISRRGEKGVWATLATQAAVDAATVARELGFEAGELELEEIDTLTFTCLTFGIQNNEPAN